MKRVRFSLLRTVLLAAVLLAGVFTPAGARAQFSEIGVAETVTEGEPANFFISWQGEHPVDGFYVRLPRGWRLDRVRIAELMGSASLQTNVRRRDADRHVSYRVAAESPLSGRYQNILQMQVGDELGTFRWGITPYVETENSDSLLTRWEYSGSVEVEQSLLFEEQYAVTFDARVAERPGLAVESNALSLSLAESFTTEFWMKTVYVNEVVLSTWDGRERSAYPVEIMIGSRGYLTCYRGVGGMHHSLTSSRPLADGKWHHVAVTHDSSERWTRLIVDGQTVDSLHIQNDAPAAQASRLIVGGRPSPRYTAGDIDPRSYNYSGALDELRVWNHPRREKQIRSNMHRQIEQEQEDDELVRVGFDDPDIDRRFTGETAAMQFVRSELSLFDPIEQLSAERRSGGVEVTWEAVPSYSEAFVVERSTDGQYFEPVARVPSGSAEEDARRRSRQYSVTDPSVHEGVVFYRVRQVVSDEERQPMAKTIKVGLRSPRRNQADLVGNFPNPFNASTVIKYELYEPQHVRLEVWDMSGHRRASLVNKTQEPGEYDVRFEATKLPSGAYVIRLETKRATRTHTMILMK